MADAAASSAPMATDASATAASVSAAPVSKETPVSATSSSTPSTNIVSQPLPAPALSIPAMPKPRAPSIGPIAMIPPYSPKITGPLTPKLTPGLTSSTAPAKSPAPSPAPSQPVASTSRQPSQPPSTSTPAAASPVPAAPAPAPAQKSAAYRPLNVRDALTYLDEVKAQFAAQPEVYNRFLDIMKDFKTQNIDTPGVIQRVSSLFRGHPFLIQGFNTFLPPGYRIECSSSADASTSYITVTTPTGTVTHTQNPGSLGEMTAQQRINAPLETASNAPTPAAAGGANGHLVLPPTDMTQSQLSVATPGAASVLGGMTGQNAAAPGANRPPLEFNHAISYVNKIKQRFVGDPQTYKVFLEILQTYQKEQRPIQEVYRQVTTLFAGATDLLDEFKQFLPDTSDPSAAGQPQADYFNDVNTVRAGTSMRRTGTTLSQVAGAASRATARESTKKRSTSTRYTAPEPTPVSKPKRAKHTHVPKQASPPPSRPNATTISHRDAIMSAAEQRAQMDASTMARIQMLGLPGAPLTTTEELSFFDRAKKHIDNKQSYQEFLKLLSLFTHDIIDLPCFANMAFLFIGDNDELFAQFKELIGWDSAVDGLVEGEEWIVDNVDALERARVEVNTLTSYPPSYRRLPKDEIDLACSGRDALCWSVLNDTWISHRTWLSEYSGAHRKSVNETVLADAEQERHWFDVQLEVLGRAIVALETVQMRIDRMAPEEKEGLTLEPGLGGGYTKAIYEKAIKRVYGIDRDLQHVPFRSDHAQEVIAALYESPIEAVPVILGRLKQKDEEYRRAKREWNRVWREVDLQNWYRSLDHQAAPFKNAEKNAIKHGALVGEIAALRENGERKRVGFESVTPALRSHHQLEFCMNDRQVLFDVFRLALSYLDRDTGSTSAPEKARVETCLREFITAFFGFTADELDDCLGFAIAPPESGGSSNGIHPQPAERGSSAPPPADDESEVDGDEHGASGSRAGQISDLRRHLLANAGVTSQGSRAASPSTTDGGHAAPNGTAPAEPLTAEQLADLGSEKTWIRAQREPWNDTGADLASSPMRSRQSSGSQASDSASRAIPRRYNFFSGTNHYALVRHIHLLYHRLSNIKQLAAELAATPRPPRLSPFAVELGLATPLPIIDEGENPASGFYNHSLWLCEELFDKKITDEAFEEQLRYMFGIKAYTLFAVQSLASGIIKHIQTTTGNTDIKSRDLFTLLQRDRDSHQQTVRQQIAWRMEAEDIVGRWTKGTGREGIGAIAAEPLFRLEWIPAHSALTIQLLGPDDMTLDDAFDGADSWEYYRASYVLTNPTEGIGAGVVAPLLRRNRELVAGQPEEGVYETSSALDISFGKSTYRIRFNAGSGDVLARKAASSLDENDRAAEVERQAGLQERKKAKFEAWIAHELDQQGVEASRSAAIAMEVEE